MHRIGDTLFVDGVRRDVFEDADGRQFVLDENDQPIYDIWIYIDEPLIVEIQPSASHPAAEQPAAASQIKHTGAPVLLLRRLRYLWTWSLTRFESGAHVNEPILSLGLNRPTEVEEDL